MSKLVKIAVFELLECSMEKKMTKTRNFFRLLQLLIILLWKAIVTLGESSIKGFFKEKNAITFVYMLNIFFIFIAML